MFRIFLSLALLLLIPIRGYSETGLLESVLKTPVSKVQLPESYEALLKSVTEEAEVLAPEVEASVVAEEEYGIGGRAGLIGLFLSVLGFSGDRTNLEVLRIRRMKEQFHDQVAPLLEAHNQGVLRARL